VRPGKLGRDIVAGQGQIVFTNGVQVRTGSLAANFFGMAAPSLSEEEVRTNGSAAAAIAVVPRDRAIMAAMDFERPFARIISLSPAAA